MLIQQDFHSPAKKQTLAKWNSCVDFFQNHIFQPVVQPKNYLGSLFRCHTLQLRWPAARRAVCQHPCLCFHQSADL